MRRRLVQVIHIDKVAIIQTIAPIDNPDSSGLHLCHTITLLSYSLFFLTLLLVGCSLVERDIECLNGVQLFIRREIATVTHEIKRQFTMNYFYRLSLEVADHRSRTLPRLVNYQYMHYLCTGNRLHKQPRR